MKMLIREKLSPHKSKTPEGYLICRDAILGRTGTQDYRKCEIFADCAEDDTVVHVLRDSKDVFSPEAIASFENKPITCEHPDVDVTPDNYKDYAVGFVRDVRQGKVDGEDVLLGNLIITDSDIINDIENGIRTDLSCGYTCDITNEAKPRQINIRGNHVALCEQGRAGIAKIVDSVRKNGDEEKLPKLPFRLRSQISKELHRMSGFTHNRLYEVKDFITELEDHFFVDGEPLTFTREKIDGWNKIGDGMMRKVYTFSIDGYDNHIIISLYADPDTYDTTEVNAYVLDSLDKSGTKEAFKKNVKTEIEAGKDSKQAAAIAYSIKEKDGVKITKEQIVPGLEFAYEGFNSGTFVIDAVLKTGKVRIINPKGETELAELADLIHDINNGDIVIKMSAQDTYEDTYRGYDIDCIDGHYEVVLDGKTHKFDRLIDAHDGIDFYLDKMENMIRDRAIRDREYTPYFKQEVRKEIARKQSEVENAEAPDNPQTRLKFRQAKNSLMRKLKKIVKEARDE